LNRKQDLMKQEASGTEGLGGWLILPLLGLILQPFILGMLLYDTYLPIFTEGYWEILTSPESEAYHQLWGPLIIFELVGNIGFMLFALVLLVFFFRKDYRVPGWIILYLASNAIFVTADFFLADLIPAVAANPDPAATKEMVQTIIGAAIWIPYFKKSERVKNTFVKGRKSADLSEPQGFDRIG